MTQRWHVHETTTRPDVECAQLAAALLNCPQEDSNRPILAIIAAAFMTGSYKMGRL